MRLLISGIVGLSGLGLAIQLIGIHGSTNEQAAIRRAVRAPFQDLRRRDARALCEDFVPAVAADLTVVDGSCTERVGRLFRSGSNDTEYVPPAGLLARGRVSVQAIRRHGDHATASSVGPGAPGPVRHWQLALVHGRWRIATPATLQVHSDCGAHPFGASGCVDVLLMQLNGAR